VIESIQIRDFAIIDAVQFELEAGMTALTGETGAGKSILLDAIKLAAGDRADSDSIRDGAERAEISICFRLDERHEAVEWLADNEMDADGECVLRRVLYANGRSKAFVNGRSATMMQLRALCDRLVDIHGQHEHQSLQKASVQRELLDSYLGEPALLAEVRAKYDSCQQLKKRLQEARSGSQQREQRVDLLEMYCAELRELDLAEGQYESLQQEYRRLSNAGRLIEQSAEVLGLLYENEEQNVQSVLAHCEQQLAELLTSDGALAGSHELIGAALIQVQEASAELRAYLDTIELDADRLATVDNRIAAIQQMARKHRVEASALPALGQELEAELADLKSDDQDIDTLEAELDEALEDYEFSAAELSLKRRQTAARLSEQITQVMQQLGMENGCCVIEVGAAQELSAHGRDTISYLVSANPGQAPRALAKVASGGELSRISLAIQVIMSESSPIPTLIFDEVDSGVGGGIAEIVGRKLRLLGQGRQVLCVTHLPQVASQAHHHFRVAKHALADDTTTSVVALDEAERLEEIARMLGGVRITEQSRAHASEMMATRD
jgi:DNA repair protein RecN (Recombination protein N)